MKKFFFLAAALVAAVSMNATVYNLCVVDGEGTVDAAKSAVESAFTLNNISVEGKTASDSKSYAEVSQVNSTTDWTTSTMNTKSPAGLSIRFKDGNANKLLLKCYGTYVQPNGGGVQLVVEGLTNGEKINIVTTQATAGVKIEGITATGDQDLAEGDNVFTVSGTTVTVWAKNDGGTTTKWRIAAVKTGSDADQPQAVENTVEAVKVTKVIENGQLVIIKNGVRYNAAGAQL